ncbi:hypothetical protein [Methylobacterium sp. J-068]|uniref:hypothetical protein n=1 Tax=Methylobacterium sp. J-068 TaxID=2836649 RepID=UPI001FB8E60D|nr:hypothetical protein [Methylobacterium sp. J-068]MCJ2034351.1 hypothetical protein [Methylobacterium sp. J-068]
MITFQELATFSSFRSWTLSGENAVVKAVSVEDAVRPASLRTATGYVTQAKFLRNLNSLQIESSLGLRPNSMKKGCYVFYFAEMPKLKDVDQRFTADLPDGKVWSETVQQAYEDARAAARQSGSDRIEFYPPGSAKIMQWQLMRPSKLSGLWKLVTPSVPFEV